uniref:Major facilitator superfamily (MFS) profile domain-containing protein n=1 Tax=Daucus carota subsp. sativus TaxID=79200 RepID=A0A165XNB9_DAUCS
MRGAVLVAVAATIGNMLQGWDNATIAGAVFYIKREFSLETQPTLEGLIVAMSLIGATLITTFSGPVSDSVGRRPMIIASSVLYFLGGIVMFWSPNVYVLLIARLIDGFGVGLAVTLVPLYISETAPSEIRGLLNTLPQFTGCVGMFFAYCMVFGMSLLDAPSWRLMLGVLSIPSVVYFALAAFFLPESPRWLASKGRMEEAKHVLQRLRGREDVSGEMVLLVEGLGTGADTTIEEYIIEPDNEIAGDPDHVEKDKIKLYGAGQGQSLVAKAVRGQSMLGVMSRTGSMAVRSASMMDPMVTLFGSVHEKLPEMGSMLFSHTGSMLNVPEQPVNDQWDEENLHREGDHHYSDASGGESDDNESNPISRRGSILSPSGADMTAGDAVHASALVSQSVLHVENLPGQHPVGAAMTQRPKSAKGGPSWSDLLEPGVKHALIVGVGIQILQQFSGINGVMYYTPQILDQAGVGILLSDLGISSESASFLISGLTTLLMIPSIAVAMRLMDIAGRRFLLLGTLPVLLASLVLLVLANTINLGSVLHAIISTVCVIVYFCFFVMGFGPIPNILCSEIFPTRVRGLCIAITALTFWFGDILVTYSLPVMLNSVGLSGVFGCYAFVCAIAWIFVYMKVPETKGMPLEVITEFFAVGAKQSDMST